MTEHTPLDAAHAAMTSNPDDDAARLRFYDRLAQSELFLLLEDEAAGDQITPRLIEEGGQSFVLAFDRQDRLSTFAATTAAHVALSGRAAATMLAPAGLGLALNIDVAPSAILLPPSAMQWLDETLAQTPQADTGRIAALGPPQGLPEALLTALDARLATATGLARYAGLVHVQYENGTRGHLLGFVGALPEAHSALTQAASEALTFSGIEAGAMDVAFFDADTSMAQRLATTGLRFDLPQPETLRAVRPAPGSDPEKPPILK